MHSDDMSSFIKVAYCTHRTSQVLKLSFDQLEPKVLIQ